jgi:hypothetical protein
MVGKGETVRLFKSAITRKSPIIPVQVFKTGKASWETIFSPDRK